MNDKEIRSNNLGVTLESRDNSGKPKSVLSGYAAVFYRDGDVSTEFRSGQVIERMMPSAFDAMLSEKHDVRALWNHNPEHVLGRSKAGTLRLSTDAIGLRYEIDLPDTQAARDLATSVTRGDVDGSSFAFQVRKLPNGDPGHSIKKHPDGSYVRSVQSVNLLDISPVTYPAYAGTSASMRDLEAAVAELETINNAKDANTDKAEIDAKEQFDLQVRMALVGPAPFVPDDI